MRLASNFRITYNLNITLNDITNNPDLKFKNTVKGTS